MPGIPPDQRPAEMAMPNKGGGGSEEGTLRFLRPPQLHALETYWFLRLVKQTPQVMTLYREYFLDTGDFCRALEIPLPREAINFATIDGIVNRVNNDLEFVKKYKLDALRETMNLDYPSYIFALAMGTGKTVLIGTIIATEFCMSMRYQDSEKIRFMRNALVFAPGTTIIQSLREISDMPFDQVLPPVHHEEFLAQLKVEFPHTKNKELQALPGSVHNLIVTNTEKIRLTAKRRKDQSEIEFQQKQMEANLRLQKIIELPNLGIFSDEAHHTYGNPVEKIKRVRETVDFIHKESPLVAAINTTGTPYYKHQTLKEVVVWYGLKEGIEDNILKSLNDGVYRYEIPKNNDEKVIVDIVQDFFRKYGKLRLPDGTSAKMAFYFKSITHLKESKMKIQHAMLRADSNAKMLINTQESSDAEIARFQRLNSPDSNDIRVILLVQKGVEGWNCPSLFACALIKKQTSSTFVLQASTRCLRQVPGNSHPARIYLDNDNAKSLDKELKRNFKTELEILESYSHEHEEVTIKVLKQKLPLLEITKSIQRYIPDDASENEVIFSEPSSEEIEKGVTISRRRVLSPVFDGRHDSLIETGEEKEIAHVDDEMTCLTAAWKISSNYHLPYLQSLSQIRKLYPNNEVPYNEYLALTRQAEKQTAKYSIVEETVTDALALIRVHDQHGKPLFATENGQLVHKIRFSKANHNRLKQANLLVEESDTKDENDLSYHYVPYVFDSRPERSFFDQILNRLNIDPEEVKHFLFLGGLTDTAKTDFFFEYLGEDGQYHNYFPDFVVITKNNEFLIVEVKGFNMKDDDTVKRKAKAVEELSTNNARKLSYKILYAKSSEMERSELLKVTEWISQRRNNNA